MNDANTENSRLKTQSSILRRASMLAQQGLYDEACEVIREGERLAPHNPQWSIRLAEIYKAQNRIGAAVEAMRQAVRLDPRNVAVQEQLLRTLLDMGRYDELVSISRKLIRRSPRNVFARDILSLAYFQQGMLDQALRMVDELILINPMDSCNYFKKGVLLQQKGEMAGALEAFIRALEMEPDGEMAEDAKEAIVKLDAFQLRRVLTLAMDDLVFRAKLILEPERALTEKGFRLSPNGIARLKQLDLTEFANSPHSMFYH